MPSVSVTVINRSSNTFTLNFANSSGAIDLVTAGVNRLILDYDGTDLDTDDAGVTTGAGNNVDWTTDGANGNIIFKLGTLASVIPVGSYVCSIKIFTSSDTVGQEWRNKFHMLVVDSVEDV